ncbi:uncharacterized protein ACR2FA_008913 [Aphomia sociella]
MNRNQRRFSRVPPKTNDSEGKIKVYKTKNGAELEEVLPPKARRCVFKTEKPMTNRCCYFSPDKKDFGQLFETDEASEKDQNQIIDEYDFDPVIPDTINRLKELRDILCSSTKVENSSQYANPGDKPVSDYIETLDGSQWQNIDNADEIDKYIRHKDKVELCLSQQSIHISEIPRVKIIAEKFSKLKKNNIELRKLDEKVVCVEYDIYAGNDMLKPRQTMRAFFSIKPAHKSKDDNNEEFKIPAIISSGIKHTFNIEDEDLKKLNDKEIEIIDGKIVENRSYLDDLNRILRRNQAILAKKNKTTLDLMSLYEMAKKDKPLLDDFSNSNFLSSAELEEMKDLILKKCASSVHGISRRRVKCEKETELMKERFGVLSQSLVAELMREGLNVK